ncbi:MAG: hypothetical protein MI754_12345, partial [Chromatiales bacterium]|nr:hypothetical protein [Chromatiales bacterium]
FIFVTCLVITLVIYFLSRFFTKQFSQLGDALKGLYVGNYYIRLHVERIDEVGYAKRQFNELAEQMEAYMRESEPDYKGEDLPESKISETPDKTVLILRKEEVT